MTSGITGTSTIEATPEAIVEELLERIEHTESESKSVSVRTTSDLILNTNSKRLYASFVNNSDEVIYLEKGKAAVVGQGIALYPMGGSYEINLSNLYRGAIYAIHGGTGTKALCVGEGSRS